MNAERALSIVAGIVTLATVTVIVTKPNTARVITAVGNSFSSSLKVAMGG